MDFDPSIASVVAQVDWCLGWLGCGWDVAGCCCCCWLLLLVVVAAAVVVVVVVVVGLLLLVFLADGDGIEGIYSPTPPLLFFR